MGQRKAGGGLRALLAALFLLLACAPGQATALRTGISEQQPAMFGNPLFQSLAISHVRLVVPWNAALVDDERSRVWLDAALARRSNVMVTFAKARGMACPGSACVAPTIAEYEGAVAAFRARWPQITEITPWNEPNHPSEPTYGNTALAGEYYNAARRVCPGCRLIAGDFLDDANLEPALRIYRSALTEQPSVWGLHNYWDATYFGSAGVDTMLRTVPGELWLTETGGIVKFGTLAHDEKRAADSIRWLYSMTRSRPRVKRMYLYHWQGSTAHDFDGGLIGPDGSERLGLAVVREELARQGAASSGGAAGGGAGGGGGTAAPDSDGQGIGSSVRQASPSASAVRVRLSGKALRLLRRGLRVQLACVSAPSRCRGRAVIKVAGRSAASSAVRLALTFDMRPGQTATRFLRVGAQARALIEGRRKVRVTYCVKGAVCRTQSRAVVRK